MTDTNRRYARQLPVIGTEGQGKLTQARVLVVGLGGLGCPAALYLAAAGVGTIGLMDGDAVEESNLHRQVLYSPADIGKRKALAAKEALCTQNPQIIVNAIAEHITAENAERIISEYDVIVDGTDGLAAKFLINHICQRLLKPLVYGAAIGMEGQLAVLTRDTACLACFVKPAAAATCATGGVLATTPATIGVLQAAEAVKLIVGMPVIDGLLVFDAVTASFRTFPIRKNHGCTVCGAGTHISGRSESPPMEQGPEITVQDLRMLMDRKAVTLVDVREPWERDICVIAPSELIPLGSLDKKLGDFDNAKLIIFYCHTGVRSLVAAQLARKKGLAATSLAGGIAAWAEQIEPGMARY